MTTKTNFAVVVIAIAFFSGCASVPLASKAEDQAAKTFAQAPDKTSVYIFRDESFGAAIPMRVAANGQMLGGTAAHTYFFLELEPGEYDLVGYAENESKLSLDARPGETRYVWQEVKMGAWQARNLLHEVDEERGRRGVMSSKLIKLVTDPAQVGPKKQQGSDVTARLEKIKHLREQRLISETEYESKRAEILSEL